MKTTGKNKQEFEQLFRQIEQAVKKIEEDSLSVSEGMELYEKTIEKVKKAQKMLEDMEHKIEEIGKA